MSKSSSDPVESTTIEATATEMPSEEEEKAIVEEKFKLHIAIHSLIESSQSQHGLRHTDYAQYRSYCTRRLSRLRHAKPFRTELSKITTKSTEKGSNTKGGRHAFKPAPYYRGEDSLQLTLEVAATHENFMLVELMSAERAWCHAMELKADVDDGRTQSRGHFMKRLKKAVQFANRLQQMAIFAADERSNLEAKAYAAWMRGNLSLEKSDYKSACVEYATAFAVCRELANITNGTGADAGAEDVPSLEMRDYFLARAENVIEPMLRFCQYELRDSGMSEHDIADLMKELHIDSSPSGEKEGSNMNTTTNAQSSTPSIQFRNQIVPISNHSLRVALLKLDTLISTHNKNKLTKAKDPKKVKKQELAFLDLLSGYDDANGIVSKEHKEMEGLKSGPAVDAKKRELESIRGFLTYQKLKLMMERKEQLVNDSVARAQGNESDTSKLDEITHLYDALLQDARTVAALPGGPDDTGGVEDDFLLEANAHILRFRALRCYYMGRIYDAKQKHKEAIALFNHALELATEAAEELNACASSDSSSPSVFSCPSHFLSSSGITIGGS